MGGVGGGAAEGWSEAKGRENRNVLGELLHFIVRSLLRFRRPLLRHRELVAGGDRPDENVMCPMS